MSFGPLPPSPAGPPITGPIGGLLARAIALATLGYLLAGVGGALFAGLAALIAVYDARLVALYALVGVALTGLLAVFETPLNTGSAVSSFVGNHPATAFVGRLAGVLFLVAVVTLSINERTTPIWDAPASPVSTRPPLARWALTEWTVPLAMFALGFLVIINLAGDRLLRWLSVPCVVLVLAAVIAVGRRHWEEPMGTASSPPDPPTV